MAMQEAKASGKPPFEVDAEFLARHAPGLLLTQDSCSTCDAPVSIVQQVGRPSVPTRAQTPVKQTPPARSKAIAAWFRALLQRRPYAYRRLSKQGFWRKARKRKFFSWIRGRCTTCWSPFYRCSVRCLPPKSY